MKLPGQPASAGRIAFVGAGQMGAPMVRRLLAAIVEDGPLPLTGD